MSITNSYIKINQYSTLEEEKEKILIIIDNIYKLEEKIKILNEELNKSDINSSKYIEIKELKKEKNKLLFEINENKNKKSKNISIISNNIKCKQNELKDIEQKINNLKNILNTYNTFTFDSNFISTNNLGEQNDKIIEKIVNSKISNLNKQIANDIKMKEEIVNNKNIIICKINEIDENLKMLKEEKNIIKLELVNYISCKESIDSVIKSNINSILININNYNNNSNKQNNNYLYENAWKEILELDSYELKYINPIACSQGIVNDIFGLLDQNNIIKNNKKGKNLNKNRSASNLNLIPNLKSNDELNYMNKSYYNYNKENINIIKSNQRNGLQNLITSEINNIISNNNKLINYYLKKLANKIIIKINEFGYNDNKIYINLNNLIIYLSFYLKKTYYKSVINIKLQFLNKDYKYMKKEFNKIKLFLIQDLKNLEDNINNINNEILLIEKEIKSLEKNSFDNKDFSNYLSIDEKNYIKIYKNINDLIEKKNNILQNIEKYENTNNIKIQEINSKINNLNNNINEIDKQINEIKNYIIINKSNLDKEILEAKKNVSEKYNDIKNRLKIIKKKYENNNMNKYNAFIGNIKNLIKNKYYKSLINLENIFSFNNQNNNSIKNIKFINGELLSSRSFKELSLYKNNNKISNENSIITNIEKNELENTSSFIIDENNNEDYSNYSNISIANNSKIKHNHEIKLIRNNISNLSTTKVNESNNNTKISWSRIPYPYTKRYNNSFLDNIKIKNYNKNQIQRNQKKKIFISNSSIENLKQTKSSNISLINTNISENQSNNNTKYIFRNDNKKLEKSKSCLSLQNNFTLSNLEFFKRKITKQNEDNKDNSIYFFKSSNNFSNLKYRNNISYINDIFFNKSNPLLRKIFCYYRIINSSNLKKFNPIKDDPFLLTDYPYNYIKSTICLNNYYDSMEIHPCSRLNKIIYSINSIINTEMNSLTKIIIEINQNFKKYKSCNSNWNKEEFIRNQKLIYIIFEEDEIEKCCYNQYFNFFISFKDNKKIEFLFSSYEEFKLWINGINFIIKNKKDINYLIDKRKKVYN